MNLKILIRKTGLSQIELAKKLGVNSSVLSLQVNMHKILPVKHIDAFCKEVGIKKIQLIRAMKAVSRK